MFLLSVDVVSDGVSVVPGVVTLVLTLVLTLRVAELSFVLR